MSKLWYGGTEWKVVYDTIFYFSALLYIVSFFTTASSSVIIIETANILLGTGLIFEICLYGSNLKDSNGNPTLDMLKIAKYAIPLVLMIGNLIYTLVLMISNQKDISEGYVSPGFYTFINIYTILVLIQLYIFLSSKKDIESRLTSVSSSFLVLIGIINIFCVITIYIILTYFKTDG